MWTRQYKHRNTGRLILPLVCTAFVGYFGYHTYSSEYGMNSAEQLDARRIGLKSQLVELRTQRLHIEHRAQLLRDGTLEKDMLDEQARRALNVSRQDEVMIMIDPPGTD